MTKINDVRKVTTVKLNCFETELNQLATVVSNYMQVVSCMNEKIMQIQLVVSDLNLKSFLHASTRMIQFTVTSKRIFSSDINLSLKTELDVLNALTVNRN